MIVNVNPRGHSFKGVTAYLLHDKGAKTSERVLWTSTHNLHTDDVARAAKFMAWTDQNRESLRANAAGAKGQAGNVYHFSLSRTAEAAKGQNWMAESAHAAIRELKLDKHQYYLVAHNDTEHEHVHAVVSLVNPKTGRIAQVRGDFKTLDRWANAFEKEHGIECPNRAKKYEAWEQQKPAFEEKAQRADRQEMVTRAFRASDNAQAFQSALQEQGLQLAKGNRRGIVIVDQEGAIFALNRLIELEDGAQGRAKSRVITERLAGLDREELLEADELAEERKTRSAEARKERVPEDTTAIDRDKEQDGRKQTVSDTPRETSPDRQAEWAQRVRKADETLRGSTAESRARWQIDELTEARDQAREELAGLNTWWARIFKRRAIAQAKEKLVAAETRLETNTKHFEADLARLKNHRARHLQAWEVRFAACTATSDKFVESSTRKPFTSEGFRKRFSEQARIHEPTIATKVPTRTPTNSNTQKSVPCSRKRKPRDGTAGPQL